MKLHAPIHKNEVDPDGRLEGECKNRSLSGAGREACRVRQFDRPMSFMENKYILFASFDQDPGLIA